MDPGSGKSIRTIGIIGVVILCCTALTVRAQDDITGQQLWFNWVTDVQLSGSTLLDTEVAYNQSLNESKWREFAFTTIFEYYPARNIDLLAGSAFSLVRQTDTLSSFEIRPIVGVRFHFRTQKRLYFRYLFRYEYRYFNYQNGSTSATDRIRNRIEMITSLTADNYYAYTNLYLITDFELYTQLGEDPSERYFYQNRARIGLGYKHNPRWKFEYLLTRQISRNTIEEDLSDNLDFIHRFYVKFYPKAKVEK